MLRTEPDSTFGEQILCPEILFNCVEKRLFRNAFHVTHEYMPLEPYSHGKLNHDDEPHAM